MTGGKHLCRTNIVETRIQRGCGHLITLEGINDMQSKMNNQTREGKVGKKNTTRRACYLAFLQLPKRHGKQAIKNIKLQKIGN